MDIKELVPKDFKLNNEKIDMNQYEKGMKIFDMWFESGMSWDFSLL